MPSIFSFAHTSRTSATSFFFIRAILLAEKGRIANFNGIRGNIRMPHKTDFIRLLDVVEDVLQHAAGFPEMPVDYERAESHPVSLMFHPSLLNG